MFLIIFSYFLDLYLMSFTEKNDVLRDLSYYLIERCLQDSSMLAYNPSIVAASALILANQKLGKEEFPISLKNYCGYEKDEEDMKNCISDMLKCVSILHADNSLNSVMKKFTHIKYSSVSTIYNFQ